MRRHRAHDDARPGPGLDSRCAPGRRCRRRRSLRVHTDTRTLAAGDLFVALKGERFDANDFLADARARGAVAAIAHRGLEAAGLRGPRSARHAWPRSAPWRRGWRSQFDLPLIAVTGSNGKTTVTQMIASILRAACGDGALATAGNFNNEIGVPLTLLRLRARHQRSVVELGMNHPGEIARLARDRAARPSRWSTTRSASTRSSWPRSRRWRARTAPSSRRCRPQGTAVFPARRRVHAAVARDRARRRIAPLPDLRRPGRCRHRAGGRRLAARRLAGRRPARPWASCAARSASPAATT